MAVRSAIPRSLLAAYRWLLETEASTRPVALILMGLIAVIWARWAEYFIFYRHMDVVGFMAALAFYVATSAAFVGLFTRTATAITAACCFYLVYYVGHYGGHEPFVHHHTTLLAWSSLLLALTPSGRSYSVDRWRALARAERSKLPPPPEIGNLWGQRLMMLQLASIYFWGAYDKTNLPFLGGDRMQHYAMYYYSGSSPLAELFPGAETVALLAGTGIVLLEYALAFGLFFASGRRWLVLPGLMLHAAFYASLSVYTYTATVWVLYLAVFDPDAVHRVIERMSGHHESGHGPSPDAAR